MWLLAQWWVSMPAAGRTLHDEQFAPINPSPHWAHPDCCGRVPFLTITHFVCRDASVGPVSFGFKLLRKIRHLISEHALFSQVVPFVSIRFKGHR